MKVLGQGRQCHLCVPMLVPLLPGIWTPDSPPFPFSSDLGFPRAQEHMD